MPGLVPRIQAADGSGACFTLDLGKPAFAGVGKCRDDTASSVRCIIRESKLTSDPRPQAPQAYTVADENDTQYGRSKRDHTQQHAEANDCVPDDLVGLMTAFDNRGYRENETRDYEVPPPRIHGVAQPKRKAQQ